MNKKISFQINIKINNMGLIKKLITKKLTIKFIKCLNCLMHQN